MENGEVVEIGDVKEVFSNPKTKTAHNFVTTVVNMEPSKSLIDSFNRYKNESDIDLKLFIDQEQIEYPLLNEMINNYHLNVNVLFSSMSEIQGDTVCYMWIRIKKMKITRNSILIHFLKITKYIMRRFR